MCTYPDSATSYQKVKLIEQSELVPTNNKTKNSGENKVLSVMEYMNMQYSDAAKIAKKK